MNVLLFAPGLFILLIKRYNFKPTKNHNQYKTIKTETKMNMKQTKPKHNHKNETHRFGIKGAIEKIIICGFVQIVVGFPFLRENWFNYMKGSFDLGRVFLYEWTVNLKFLPENIFVSKQLALLLLCLHVCVLIYMIVFKWTNQEGGITYLDTVHNNFRISSEHIVSLLFISNFVGIVFARSLHFQFYVWYFHTIPYLLSHSTPMLPMPLQ
jgi:hypothetical protein